MRLRCVPFASVDDSGASENGSIAIEVAIVGTLDAVIVAAVRTSPNASYVYATRWVAPSSRTVAFADTLPNASYEASNRWMTPSKLPSSAACRSVV
jgi:hypothetical protein